LRGLRAEGSKMTLETRATPEELLREVRDTYYMRSWARMANDLKRQKKIRWYDCRLIAKINADLAEIEKIEGGSHVI
jgi:hypothetical protein